MANFESLMATALAAITWTKCTSQPSTCYGDANPVNPIAFLRVRNSDEEIKEGTTYAGSIAFRTRNGTIEGFAMSSTSRNNMTSDLEDGLGGQGFIIDTKVENTFNNRHSFYMNLERMS